VDASGESIAQFVVSPAVRETDRPEAARDGGRRSKRETPFLTFPPQREGTGCSHPFELVRPADMEWKSTRFPGCELSPRLYAWCAGCRANT
jgi:hypothetical protein